MPVDRHAGGKAIALGLALLTTSCGAPKPGSDGPTPTTEAAFVLGEAASPPADHEPWSTVSLPDDWSRTRPSVGGGAWYRVRFHVAADDGLLALYVPRASMVGAPFVNGIPIAEGGRFTEPLTRLWYRPQLYVIPLATLRPGSNVLHYRIRAYPDNQAGLSEIYIGPAAPLERLWRTQTFRQITTMQTTTGITAALGLLVLVAWLVLQRQSAYGYFGLAAAFWTAHSLMVLSVDIPVSALSWETLIVATLSWVVVAMMMFALRFAGLRRPRLEFAAWAYAALTPALLYLAGLERLFGVANACLLVLFVIGVYEFHLLLGVARTRRTTESWLLIGAAIFVLALGAHDWLNRLGAWAYAEPFNMHYGVPVLFLTVFWNLLGQVSRAQRTTAELNRELEARVQAKAVEIERAQERLRVIDGAAALTAERERIMRDMHDGVGSQLIAARQLAQRGDVNARELATMLDDCIDDLRLMIDSLEPSDGDLVTVLGNLRYRLSERLSRQGLTLHWHVTQLPPLEGLTPRQILQVLRVVQEAVANVVKHAGATDITFTASASPDGQAVQLTVADNGRGKQPRTPHHPTGRGLTNMAQRAHSLGGTLEITDQAPGYVVTLTVPRRVSRGDGLA